MPPVRRRNLQMSLLSQVIADDSSTNIGLSSHAKSVSSCTRNFSRGLKSRSGNIEQGPDLRNKSRGEKDEDNFKWFNTNSSKMNLNLLTGTMLEPENFFKFSDTPLMKGFRAARQKTGPKNAEKVLPPREEMHKEMPRCEDYEDLLPYASRLSLKEAWYLHRTTYGLGDSPESSDADDDWGAEVHEFASEPCPIRHFKPLQIKQPMVEEMNRSSPKIPDIYFSDEEDNISESILDVKCVDDEKRP